MANLVSLISQLPLIPIKEASPQQLKPVNPPIFEGGLKQRPLFLKSCQFGIVNPIIALRNGTIIDGKRRWVCAKHWHHKHIACRFINEDLEWEEVVRLCFFLNRSNPRSRTAAVPEDISWEDPIYIYNNSLNQRLDRAAETLDKRATEDLALSKVITKRRKEFSATYAEAVESALDALRTISGFARQFPEPPFPLEAAEFTAKETVHQLSFLGNSHADSIR